MLVVNRKIVTLEEENTKIKSENKNLHKDYAYIQTKYNENQKTYATLIKEHSQLKRANNTTSVEFETIAGQLIKCSRNEVLFSNTLNIPLLQEYSHEVFISRVIPF